MGAFELVVLLVVGVGVLLVIVVATYVLVSLTKKKPHAHPRYLADRQIPLRRWAQGALAAKTINRIVDSFPGEQQGQIRLQLAANLKAIISQRLLPRKDGGRIAALEIMRTTSTIQGYIEQPEKTSLIRDAIIDGQSQYGMQIFDHHLKALYLAGEITLDVATSASSSPNDFQRSLVFN